MKHKNPRVPNHRLMLGKGETDDKGKGGGGGSVMVTPLENERGALSRDPP